MQTVPDRLFKTLADPTRQRPHGLLPVADQPFEDRPTGSRPCRRDPSAPARSAPRRAIFERLIRDGEQTVRALTDRAGVSQPAVSKHLGVLKLAGLVRDRPEGRSV